MEWPHGIETSRPSQLELSHAGIIEVAEDFAHDREYAYRNGKLILSTLLEMLDGEVMSIPDVPTGTGLYVRRPGEFYIRPAHPATSIFRSRFLGVYEVARYMLFYTIPMLCGPLCLEGTGTPADAQAHLFATVLMMPERRLVAEASAGSNLDQIARHFGVTTTMAAQRLADVGLGVASAHP